MESGYPQQFENGLQFAVDNVRSIVDEIKADIESKMASAKIQFDYNMAVAGKMIGKDLTDSAFDETGPDVNPTCGSDGVCSSGSTNSTGTNSTAANVTDNSNSTEPPANTSDSSEPK